MISKRVEPSTVRNIEVKPTVSDECEKSPKQIQSEKGFGFYFKQWTEGTTLHGVKYCTAEGNYFRRFAFLETI